MKTQLAIGYFRLTAGLFCMLPLSGFSQSPSPGPTPVHDGDGGPVLVVLFTEESYQQENRTALHCSGTDECQLCEYRPDAEEAGACSPGNARFYISERFSTDDIYFTGIDHNTAVEITPLVQEHSRHLSCPTTESEMPRCRLQNRTEEQNSDFCSGRSTRCGVFVLMVDTLYETFVSECRLHHTSCSPSGFINYYQTPVVIKNDYRASNSSLHKAVSCNWASGNSDETGTYCRMVSGQDCDMTQNSRNQCQPQKFILHMERPYLKPCSD